MIYGHAHVRLVIARTAGEHVIPTIVRIRLDRRTPGRCMGCPLAPLAVGRAMHVSPVKYHVNIGWLPVGSPAKALPLTPPRTPHRLADEVTYL